MKFETIRWATIATVFVVVSYGFFIPISVIQALAYNPMLIICLLAIAGYTSIRINGIKQTADIHHLGINNKLDHHAMSKAA